MEERVVAELGDLDTVHILTSAEMLAADPGADLHSAVGERLGHVPYRARFFTALGTMITRKFHALTRPPYKAIVLDGDQTLWRGVCGEDGPTGVELDPPRKVLQEFMLRQLAAGRLLCLCSKNNEDDVRAVFEARTDMPLQRDHFAAWRVNWRPKSENIRALAEELGIGSDSMIVLDDDPVECAELRANVPSVLTLQLPNDPDVIPGFLEQVWAFDIVKATEEDARRAILMRQARAREGFQEAAFTFAEFLAGLGLRVHIGESARRQFARVAQLTQRTNQMNFTAVRRTEGEVRMLVESGALECLVAEASDRFGDYGLVGAILFRRSRGELTVDTFVLSCRALGKGIEHRMIARLGEIATVSELGHVEVPFRPSAKNHAALEFLSGIGAKPIPLNIDGHEDLSRSHLLFRFPADLLVNLSYKPGTRGRGAVTLEPAGGGGFAPRPSPESRLLARVTTELRDVDQVLVRIEQRRRRESRGSDLPRVRARRRDGEEDSGRLARRARPRPGRSH